MKEEEEHKSEIHQHDWLGTGRCNCGNPAFRFPTPTQTIEKRWSVTIWEHNEYVLTFDGKPVSQTYTEREADVIAAFLNSKTYSTIYHQLLLEDHQRLIEVVEGLPAKVETTVEVTSAGRDTLEKRKVIAWIDRAAVLSTLQQLKKED